MKKLITCICLVALMLVTSFAAAEMVQVRLGPYSTTGVQAWVGLDTNGPVFYQISGTHSNLDIDFETSIYPTGYRNDADSLAVAVWTKIETAITANGTGAIAYVGNGFLVDVDAFTGTDVNVDLWYWRDE